MNSEPEKKVASAKSSASLRSALRYAERGWPVFPLFSRVGNSCTCKEGAACTSPGKHPIGTLVPHGFKSATTDEKTIKLWWRKYPTAGIGIATGEVSGLIVLDIDNKPGPDGTIALGELLARLGPLPDTRTAITPCGGQHLYFPHAKGVGSSTDRLGRGLNLKSIGGYVVAAPSHNLYKWADATAPIAALPSKWIEHLRKLSAPRA